jgi:DNA polymerase IV
MQPVRLPVVRLSNLRYESNQLSLFPDERKKAMLVNAMDEVVINTDMPLFPMYETC